MTFDPVPWSPAVSADPFAAGREVVASSSARLPLVGSGSAWLLLEGRVELFAREIAAGEDAPLEHLASFEPGAFLFGTDATDDADTPRLLATGVGETRLAAFEPEELLATARRPEARARLAEGIETWVGALADAVTLEPPPADLQHLAAGREVSVEAGRAVGADSRPVWLRLLSGTLRWSDQPELAVEPGDHLAVVAGDAWLAAADDCLVSTVETETLLASGRLWEELERFHRLCARALAAGRERTGQAERERLERRLELDEQALIGAQAGLAAVLSATPARWIGGRLSDEPLVAACRLVGEAQGIDIRSPREGTDSRRHPVAAVAAASQVGYRRVILRDSWWRRDNGPLVGFRKVGDDDGSPSEPVALVPLSPRRYQIVDPRDGSTEVLDAAAAERLEGEAFMFYPPLPEGELGLMDLAKVAFSGQRRELSTLLTVGLAGGLLALLIPVVTAEIFGQVIPDADRPQLVRLTFALIVAAVAGALFQVTRGIAVLRMGVRIDGVVQAAVWQRLLSLPADFFRRFTVGDLGERTMGVEAIRETLSGQVTSAVFGAVFSVFSFAILFWYSTELAWTATALVSSLLLTSAWLAWLQLRHQRRLLAVRGRIATLLYGFFHGLGKLRIAAAEERAYNRWAQQFAEQRRLTLEVQRVANLQTVINAVYAVGSTLVIFAVAGWEISQADSQLEVSSFLAFIAALGQFQAAALSLLGLFSSLLLLKPIYERLRPILTAEPEVDTTSIPAGDLEGDVEVSHVSFRYRPDDPLVLDDVSLRARPGELIALVGPSGSGKSTLLRLLLGFEQPGSGSIYFDGQELSSLDPHSVRRQIGVVLQDGLPMSGDVFTNIVGTSGLGIEDAWKAAEMAGLAEDIHEMPMGMHTVINERAGTFSGGQRQRLLIARALVRRPRLLFLDEATSALDNRTQEIVSRSLDQLEATRVVVAHRLSTIRDADRIYVLDRGRLVEDGTYDQLVDRGGLFARLVERQTL